MASKAKNKKRKAGKNDSMVWVKATMDGAFGPIQESKRYLLLGWIKNAKDFAPNVILQDERGVFTVWADESSFEIE